MARLLLFGHNMVAAGARAGLGPAALLVCAAVLMMCASHGRRWRRLIPSRRCSSDPVIELDMDSRFQPGGDGGALVGGEGGHLCVWQKKILMGDKCQLPDFSGIICYDSDGNIIPVRGSRKLQLALEGEESLSS